MKRFVFLVFIITAIGSCKKHKKTDEPIDTPHSGQLKSLVFAHFNSGVYLSSAKLNINYNSNGQQAYNVQEDTSFNGQSWTIKSSVISTFSYTTFNKIAGIETSGLSGVKYIYNSSNKLIYVVILNDSIPNDTARYNYYSNYTTSSSASATHKNYSYYSQNLDSGTSFNASNQLVAKSIYKYNSTADKAFLDINQAYTIIMHQYEKIKETHWDYSVNPTSVVEYTYTREFDSQGYPVKEFRKENGVLRTITYFYYK